MDVKRHKVLVLAVVVLFPVSVVVRVLVVHPGITDVFLAGILVLLVITIGVVLARKYKNRFN